MTKGYANCGASVKPNGKTKMSKGGYMAKKTPGYYMGGMVATPKKKKTKGNVSGNMSIKSS